MNRAEAALLGYCCVALLYVQFIKDQRVNHNEHKGRKHKEHGGNFYLSCLVSGLFNRKERKEMKRKERKAFLVILVVKKQAAHGYERTSE